MPPCLLSFCSGWPFCASVPCKYLLITPRYYTRVASASAAGTASHSPAAYQAWDIITLSPLPRLAKQWELGFPAQWFGSSSATRGVCCRDAPCQLLSPSPRTSAYPTPSGVDKQKFAPQTCKGYPRSTDMRCSVCHSATGRWYWIARLGRSRARETLPRKAAEWDRVGEEAGSQGQPGALLPTRACWSPTPRTLSVFFCRVVIIECGEMDVLASPSLSSTKAARGWSFPGISQKEMASVRTAFDATRSLAET